LTFSQEKKGRKPERGRGTYDILRENKPKKKKKTAKTYIQRRDTLREEGRRRSWKER